MPAFHCSVSHCSVFHCSVLHCIPLLCVSKIQSKGNNPRTCASAAMMLGVGVASGAAKLGAGTACSAAANQGAVLCVPLGHGGCCWAAAKVAFAPRSPPHHSPGSQWSQLCSPWHGSCVTLQPTLLVPIASTSHCSLPALPLPMCLTLHLLPCLCCREPAPAAGGPPRDRSPPRGERPAGAWRPSGARREEEDRPPAPRDGDRPAGGAWRPSFARGGDDRDRRPDDRWAVASSLFPPFSPLDWPRCEEESR